MDKHLLRMGSSYKRNRSATMSLAIKAIGDSLVTPLDLNISPPAFLADMEFGDGKSKRNMFRFPSMKKKSKSQGHLVGLGHSFEEEFGLKSSKQSLGKFPHCDIRELEKELINLPSYEVDPLRLNHSTSPLFSRSNSVPEHLSASGTPVVKSPSIIHVFPAITMTTTNERAALISSSPNDSEEHIMTINSTDGLTQQHSLEYTTSSEDLQGGHTNQVCQISVSPYHQTTETNNNHPILCLPQGSKHGELGKMTTILSDNSLT